MRRWKEVRVAQVSRTVLHRVQCSHLAAKGLHDKCSHRVPDMSVSYQIELDSILLQTLLLCGSAQVTHP